MTEAQEAKCWRAFKFSIQKAASQTTMTKVDRDVAQMILVMIGKTEVAMYESESEK